MAHVVKCDQCGKIDSPNNMKYMVIQIGRDISLRGIDQNSDTMRDGDFCSDTCVSNFIKSHISTIWYAADRY